VKEQVCCSVDDLPWKMPHQLPGST
jgi:hypothetical protein